jgi:hypothetical protein
MQSIAADEYRGRRVRFSADVRAAAISKWAGLWMRVDGPPRGGSQLPPTLAFDNMQGRPISGTREWRRYEVVLDVADDARWISFGILLSGPGEAWMDSLGFEVVGSDVATTDVLVLPKRPNLSFQR